MRSIHKDFLGVGLLLLLVLLNQFYLIPEQVLEYGSGETYPLLLNGILGGLTLLYLLEAIRRHRKKMDLKALIPLKPSAMAKPLLLLLLIWAWAELVEIIGFLTPSALLLFIGSFLYGERSVPKMLLLAVIFPVCVLALFTALKSALPEGPLETWILTVLRG